MEELEFVRVYLDDLLVISKGTFEDHLEKLDEVLGKLMKVGLKVNLKKSFLACTETDYLGYVVTREEHHSPRRYKPSWHLSYPGQPKNLKVS